MFLCCFPDFFECLFHLLSKLTPRLWKYRFFLLQKKWIKMRERKGERYIKILILAVDSANFRALDQSKKVMPISKKSNIYGPQRSIKRKGGRG